MRIEFKAADVEALLTRMAKVVRSLNPPDHMITQLSQALTGRGPQGRIDHWDLVETARQFAAMIGGARPALEVTSECVIFMTPEGLRISLTKQLEGTGTAGDDVPVVAEFAEPRREPARDPGEGVASRIAFFNWVRDVTATLRLDAGTKTDPVDEEALRELRGLCAVDVPV